MSRSKRKTSARRNASAAGTPAAATLAPLPVTPPAGPEKAVLDMPSPPASLPLPGSIPPSTAGNGRTGVSGLTCALCCIICLLAGLMLGNLLPHVLGKSAGTPPAAPAAGPSPAASSAVSPAPAATSGQAASAPAPAANVSSEQQTHISHLEKSLAANPQDVASWTELGNAYFDTHQPLKAIAAYERSLALRPGNPNVLTDLGIMYRESGQPERALECFDLAMQAAPSHEQARFNKGVVLLFDLHRHAEAKAVWQELLRLNPRATAPDGTGLRTLIEQCDKPLP
ncbi:tetratricopeptide repeat protein [uncultured Desulfovibrio sp.]|uniref:tetratricopeptide repeat protein n=2 Tax=uncultured Desulfovibrio sp. TaxID=167968 RepID=UPI003209BEDB